MATFVLVHGAWRGGWCWKRVAPLLRAAGHDVYVPTLTGLGERGHLANPDIGLDTQIADVLGVLKFEELSDVILVGHSYGGMVITGVADQAGEKLRTLVYLDAFVPGPGKSLFDHSDPERVAGFRKLSEEKGEGWRVPFFPAKAFGALSDADAEWIDGLCLQQPIKCMEQSAHNGDPLARFDYLTYIRAGGYAPAPFDEFAEAARNDPRWRVETLPCGHDVMVDLPRELTAILLEVAA